MSLPESGIGGLPRATVNKFAVARRLTQSKRRTKPTHETACIHAGAAAAARWEDFRHEEGQAGRLLDPSCKLEVLKCIMLREGYLARVTRLAEEMARRAKKTRGQQQSLPPGLIDLVDLLRTATIDTVEAISLWRISQVAPNPTPFMWNGHNYLIKMLHDCDFLDRVEAFRGWFGFRIRGNPFFLADGNSSHTGDGLISSVADGPVAEICFDKSSLADVGRQPWLGPLVVSTGEDVEVGGNKARSRRKKRRKAEGTDNLPPYAAAVVNEPTLLPPATASSSTRDVLAPAGRRGFNKAVLGVPPTTATVDMQGLVPNLVSREDAQRVEAARQALVEEEMRLSAATTVSVTAKAGETKFATRGLSSPTHRKSLRAEPSPTTDLQKQRASQLATTNESNQHTAPKGSTLSASDLVARDELHTPRTTTESMRSLVQTAAGLLQQPLPEPHQGLGHVLLRADLPGGELHPQPFLHTVADASLGKPNSLKIELAKNTQRKLGRGCSATPLTVDTESGCMDGCQADNLPRRSSACERVVTAPAIVVGSLPSRRPTTSDGERADSGIPRGPRVAPSSSDVLDLCHASRVASRKVGAELRALTAAGTTGRRQPPPREVRLRRLARDVARHSAELRELARAEERLRRSLTCLQDSEQGGGSLSGQVDGIEDRQNTYGNAPTNVGREMVRTKTRRQDERDSRKVGLASVDTPGVADRVKAILEAKRREIELKTFDLGIKQDELKCLLAAQKQEKDRGRTLEMERRRACLGEGQSLPEDEAVAKSLEDCSALLVQKRFRGNAARAYAAWYRNSIHQAATTIQRGVRYIWDRRATARRLLLHASARPIQAAIRMFVTRKHYVLRLRQKKELFYCCKIQKVCRGMRGRRRAAARRTMIAAAGKALEWVSLDALQPKHLKELAHAIHGALVDPLRQFPPAGILGALRVALTLLDDSVAKNSSGGPGDMVTFQTALGRTVRSAVSAPDLTWEMAARVLGRPFRLLRRMRAFASGLGASSDPTPTRLLHLSPTAAKLLCAYRSDPSWSEESLSAVAQGGTAAKALVGWATELELVYREQPLVQDFLRDAQPAWLRKSRSLQKRRRALELHAEACRHAVVVAREYRHILDVREHAYGDPLQALEVLDEEHESAEAAVRELEYGRKAFLATQANAEAAAGRALRENVEFAEREASVAARAEEMARRIGQCEPEELMDLTVKRLDCEVILRELERRLRVWKRRCQEENKPLLEEWIPPTESQFGMARALGAARAWEKITGVQKARLVREAGGRRFIKGLTGNDTETWKRVCEGVIACREDMKSGKARLAGDLEQFERAILTANKKAAAEKVSSTTWDNATEETKALERAEDEDASRDERRTAMGATLPPGLLNNNFRRRTSDGQRSSGLVERPTLLLLGTDLPASVRVSIRASLDCDAPDVFGVHLTGVDALPPTKAEARVARWGFLESLREKGHGQPPVQSHNVGIGDQAKRSLPILSVRTENYGDRLSNNGTVEGLPGHESVERTRCKRVQTTLSAGKNVSLDVGPGPGLWARGRFLRDLEALLGGLDDHGCCGERSDDGRAERPTVLLVQGHDGNRSGGGADPAHGTENAAAATSMGAGDSTLDKKRGDGVPSAAEVAVRRVKSLLEEATQCLHDLANTHGATSSPFAAISAAHAYTPTPTGAKLGHKETEQGGDVKEGVRGSRKHDDTDLVLATSAVAKCTPGLELLLAACHMMLHPDRTYSLEEVRKCHDRASTSLEHIKHEGKFCDPATLDNVGKESTLSYASVLAEECRQYLAGKTRSARDVATIIQKVDPSVMPPDTAVALRDLIQCQAWPATSPRTGFTECPASAAFTAWIVAAATASTELALAAGGTAPNICWDPNGSPLGNVQSTAAIADVFEQKIEYHGEDVETCPSVEIRKERATQFLGGVNEDRRRERDLLQKLEASLVDRTIIVLDDDSPWFFPTVRAEEKGAKRQRYCCASEALGVVMETVLRPFQVFEDAACSLGLADTAQPTKADTTPLLSQPLAVPPILPPASPRFHVSVSRAFGFIYVRAVPLDTERVTRGQAIIARAKDEDLITLLSPNWMEKHDLSALRELRTDTAVWRSLIHTLVVHYPDEMAQRRRARKHRRSSDKVDRERGDVLSDTQTSVSTMAAYGRNDNFSSTGGAPACRSGAGVLSFRHARRLTLRTVCLLMGHAVPVIVYEESRSNFWCEARVPSALACRGKAFLVGLSVPKECIPLLLHDNHPMHMRTMLDASDVRELSLLIADRLELRRVGSARRGPRSYTYWLDGAIGGVGNKPHNMDSLRKAGLEDATRNDHAPSRKFRLSLRKRGVGQVVLSRLVSFWFPSIEEISKKKEGNGGGSSLGVKRKHENGHQGSSSRRCAGQIQRLITVKQIAHRGECGELTVEVHNSSSGERAKPFAVTAELTNKLLEGWRLDSTAKKRTRLCARYWRDALTWRLRLALPARLPEVGVEDFGYDGNYMTMGHSTIFSDSSSVCRNHSVARIAVDDRQPLFLLLSVSARREASSEDIEKRRGASPTAGNDTFDLQLLPPQQLDDSKDQHSKNSTLDLIAAHRQTMAVFSFPISATTFVDEFSDIVEACVIAPTVLLTEIEQSASAILRNLASRWLSYSDGNAGKGSGATLTLRFPGMKAIRTGPYVSLRGTGCATSIGRSRGHRLTGKNLERPRNVKDYGDTLPVRHERLGLRTHESGPAHALQRSIKATADGPGNARGGISTLAVDTRNERMVFRRVLPVAQLNEHTIFQKQRIPRQTNNKSSPQAEVGESAPEVLLISVYEAFAAGLDGRVTRHLKFNARDETVRPVIETITSVPWVGPCEGVEGSALWRVVTEGLRFRRTRDERGKCVRIDLEVCTSAASEEHTSLYVPTPERQARTHVDPMPQDAQELQRDASEKRKGGETNGDYQRTHVDPTPEKRPETPAGVRIDEMEGNASVRSTGEDYDILEAPFDDGLHPSAIPPRVPLVDKSVSNAAMAFPDEVLTKDHKEEDAAQVGDDCMGNRGTKVYDGWHEITGIRLHVQCFQDEVYATRDFDGSPNNENLDSDTDLRRPTGRGGRIGFPRGSHLQFLVCDPSTGRRSGVRISVDNVRRNLSTRGGIVEAELLNAGRRPALAKAIAQNLRLLFDADGGYSVVLPLPAGWNRGRSSD